MAKLAPVHHRELEKFVKFVGCKFERQTSSHRVYWREDQVRPVIVPTYRAVPVHIIKNILRQLGISVEEYCRIMDEL